MSAVLDDREEGGAVSSATPEPAPLVPPSSDPVPVELLTNTSLHGNTIYVDGDITFEDFAHALAVFGFALGNDGSGRLVARLAPSFLSMNPVEAIVSRIRIALDDLASLGHP